MFNSAVVAVTPSMIFNSAVVAVTPSNIFSSDAVDVTPSSMFNSAAVDVIVVPFIDKASVSRVPSISASPDMSKVAASNSPDKVILVAPVIAPLSEQHHLYLL